MEFKALYYKERLNVLNPNGRVGLVTLWTPVRTIFGSFLADLKEKNRECYDKIAVVGNLYGDGLTEMLCNLLFNPQIDTIIICGQDLTGSGSDLFNVLLYGARKPSTGDRAQIWGRTKLIPENVADALCKRRYDVIRQTKAEKLTDWLKTIAADKLSSISPRETDFSESDRLVIELPAYKVEYFPSNPRAHTIVRDSPLEAWQELVFTLMRFGIPTVASRKKKRLELQNVKVVIEKPIYHSEAALQEFGFNLKSIRSYQEAFINPEKPDDVSYSYGHRMRTHFGFDALENVAEKLKRDATDRSAFISLWDPVADSGAESPHPCLVSIFFRVFQGRITLTANFRTHNSISAWLNNVYGLMRVQEFVAERAGLKKGAISIVSMSISVDHTSSDALVLAQYVANKKVDCLEHDPETGKRRMRDDANGYFTFELGDVGGDRRIVAHLKSDGVTVATFIGHSARDIFDKIARDLAISDIRHALYVGEMLAHAEFMKYLSVNGNKLKEFNM